MDSYSSVDTATLPAELSAKLQVFQPGSFCFHRSWGVGKVRSWDIISNQMTIDFVNKAGHLMDFEYATESLKALPKDHFSARLIEDVAGVREQAQSDPISLMLNMIQSFSEEATIERIEQLLVPTAIAADAWKKWWESAKRALKKDSRFVVPSRRNLPITFHDTPIDHDAKALEAFRKAVGSKAQMAAIQRLQKLWKTGTHAEEVKEVVAAVGKTLALMPKSQTGQAVELVLARDAFIRALGVDEKPADWTLERMLPTNQQFFVNIIHSLPASCQPECLERAKEIFGDRWSDYLLALLPQASARIMETLMDIFGRENRLAEVISTLDRLIRERRLAPDVFVWICKNREKEMGVFMGPQFFSAIIATLEYDQLADYTHGTRLHDMLLNEKDVVKDLLAKASEEEVRDITRAIILTTVFEELNKRSLLAMIVKLYPFVQGMVAGEGKAQQHQHDKDKSQPLIVSWDSLQRRKEEFEELVNKKIPENTRDIATARSYGDLRENHEFKAAKEMQTVLMRRKAEIENMLTIAQGTDFKGVDTSVVNIGTRVTLLDLGTQQQKTYTILGAWDGQPEKDILSYLSVIAKTLIHHSVGDELDIPSEDVATPSRVKILSIEPYQA